MYYYPVTDTTAIWTFLNVMQIVMLYSTRTRKAKTQKTGSDLRDVIMILLFFFFDSINIL